MGLRPSEIKLLFIEDDSDNIMSISEMLDQDQHTKFKVEHKTSLKESLDLLDREDCDCDVILLDLILPNSEGVETYERVRDVCKNTPIVIISKYEDIACKCVRRGAQDYILKSDLTPGLIARSLKYSIERKKIQDELRCSRKKYMELVEVTRAAIYEIDLVNNKFLYVNDVLCNLIGLSREELMEMRPTDILAEESLQRFLNRMEDLQAGKFIDPTQEYEIILKDGSTKWTLITAKFKEDENGVVTTANVVAIDITEKKKAEEEVKKKEEIIFTQLEERLHEWKEEMVKDGREQEDRIKVVSSNIQSMTNGSAEVL
jgi:PAS domain S-box-containing protein